MSGPQRTAADCGTGAGPDRPGAVGAHAGSVTLDGRSLARRSFLGMATGALLAAPLATLRIPARAADALASPGDGFGQDLPASWHVDDMWGHWPPYAHPIPYNPVATTAVNWENVDPVERLFFS